PERERPNKRLSDQNTEEGRADDLSSQQLMDRIVSNPEYARLDDSADTNKQTTDRRPPHPVERQFREKIFKRVDQRGQKTRAEPRQYPDQKRKDQTFTIQHRMLMNGKNRPGSKKGNTNGRGRGGGNCNWYN